MAHLHTSIRIPEVLDERLKAVARSSNIPVAAIIRSAIEARLELLEALHPPNAIRDITPVAVAMAASDLPEAPPSA